MRPADKPEFVRVLVGLAAIKRVDLTAEAIDLWWSAMGKWSIDDFKAASSHLVSSCEWMPTPFHFEQLRKAGEPTAGEAWAIVLQGSQLAIGSRMARAAMAVGGQYSIRHANIERDLPHIERRFKEAYEDLTDVDGAREALPEIARNHPLLADLGFSSAKQLGWKKL